MQSVYEDIHLNMGVYLGAFIKIPMTIWLTPRVMELTEYKCRVAIPLSVRSKNHLASMYLGSLCVGADLACGLLALKHIRDSKKETGHDVSLVFKDFQADFLKRAQGRTFFTCSEGEAIRACVQRALITGERCERSVCVNAYTGEDIQTPVASFQLTLSLKRK